MRRGAEAEAASLKEFAYSWKVTGADVCDSVLKGETAPFWAAAWKVIGLSCTVIRERKALGCSVEGIDWSLKLQQKIVRTKKLWAQVLCENPLLGRKIYWDTDLDNARMKPLKAIISLPALFIQSALCYPRGCEWLCDFCVIHLPSSERHTHTHTTQ